MKFISRMDLFSKLNPVCYQALESAIVSCRARGHAYVEPAHWFDQILRTDRTDWQILLQENGADVGRSMVQVSRALEAYTVGPDRPCDLAPRLLDWVERAWFYASLKFGSQQIRSAHLLVCALCDAELSEVLFRISPELKKLTAEVLVAQVPAQLGASCESQGSSTKAVEVGDTDVFSSSTAIPPAAMGAQSALAKFATDLTQKAREGSIDPVTGRQSEIRQMIDVLMRRRQNNPLITGEAGVGKTALVEGLALLIAKQEVPPALRHVRLLSLDLGLMSAGASVKGEFEQRLRQVIDEVHLSAVPVVLFIDEVHTLVGAGGQQGTGDAANLLKPALARGQLRTIGATTWAEYKKYIEKDPALTRRFQPIVVKEPDPELAVVMLRQLAPSMSAHHGVEITEEAIKEAVRLSARYIPARQLPDKAISLLDTACARVAISQSAEPLAAARLREQVQALNAELEGLQSEFSEDTQALSGKAQAAALRRAELVEIVRQAQQELDETLSRWREGRELLSQFQKLNKGSPERAELLGQLEPPVGQRAVVFARVDSACVASVVQDWTGIPVGNMLRDELQAVLDLQSQLAERIIGQDHALEVIARRVQTSRAGIEDPNKPVGVFLLAGTSGVGKTETALALAEQLYGGESNLITINLSEYQEAHTVSSLKGAPPGYVGYGEGGVLTEAVRRRPYSVVLLDEVEKAHPDVHELFFQVFDKGWMEDGEGRQIDFRHCLILLTTNVGTDALMALCERGHLRPEPTELQRLLRPSLLQVFPPALLGRLELVPYYPLSATQLTRIVELQLARVVHRVEQRYGLATTLDASVAQWILSRCNETDSGARLVGSVISGHLLPALGRELLRRQVEQPQLQANQLEVWVNPEGGKGHEFQFKFQ